MVIIKVNYTNDAPIIKVNYDDAPIYISTTVDATYISVDYGTGGGAAAVWGQITGTLSDQTDLQNALDAKVPYTGAIANVDLGEYELKAGQVEFDQTPTGTAGVGVMRWNDQEGTLDLGLKGGNVTLQVGQEQVVRVVNKTGANLLESEFKAVRISGAQGQRLGVALAQANNDNNSADTIGLVTENIDNNQEGFITTMGTVREINTTGSVYGQTWADGDVLYLSPTTPGAITNVKPVAPQHIVVLGYVEYAHANHGKIFVKVMNGWELGELHDVDTTGATNGQVLKYNGTIWAPSSDIDTGITSLNGLTALTQTFATGTSGTDFNISSATSTHTFNLPTASATNRGLLSTSDWSTFNAKQDALTLTTTGTSGAATLVGSTLNIPQYSGTNIYNSDGTLTGNRVVTTGTSTLTFNGAGNTEKIGAIINNVLLLNTLTPVVSASTVTIPLQLTAPSGSEQYAAVFSTNNKTKYLTFSHTSTDHRIYSDYTSGGALRLVFGTYANRTNQLVLFGTGNITIGGTTDAGYKLDVQGTGRFTGTINTTPPSASTAFTGYNLYRGGSTSTVAYSIGITSADDVLFNTTNADYIFNRSSVERLRIGNTSITSNYPFIAKQTIPTGTTINYGITVTNAAGANRLVFGIDSAEEAVIGLGGSDLRIRQINSGNDFININKTTGNVVIEKNASALTTIASAKLAINSTTEGFLPPRMTTTQKNAISTPATGLIVFDTTLAKLCVYSGTAWETITSI